MAEQEYITREEHAEFAKRMEQEHDRQNHRLSEVESSVRQIADLTATVKELAVNMRHMLTEQEKQGKKLDSLESQDGEKWRKAVSYVITAIGGAILAYLFAKFGLS